ncbi:unnamed protein product, partial [Closterium sp. Yama58-4]
FVFESPLPVGRLVSMVADKSQVCTQRSWRRPYGVGLLVAGFDQTGPHIFQTCPSGNFWEFHAMAIGARSQASKTYLERKFESFGACSLNELVRHALLAVKESLQEGELSGANCSVSIVGEGQAFSILTDAQVQEHIDRMENEEEMGGDELPGQGKKVCVTGASGFVGSYVVKMLLERGYHVRGTVRNLDDPRTNWLRGLADGTPGTIQLFAADLTAPGSFDEAVEGCELVCHVAALMATSKSDPQTIVAAALDGTRNVFASIMKHQCAKKVVLTSSVAAVSDNMFPSDHVFTEADWNRQLSLRAPYSMGKTLAEKYAWRVADELRGVEWRFDLVTLCPSLVLGPALREEHVKGSLQSVKQLLDGTLFLAPDLHFGIVHVADVALAHVLALEKDGMKGRYILCNGDTMSLLQMADVLRSKYPNYRVPSMGMPDWMAMLAAMVNPAVGMDFMRRNLGVVHRYSGSKAENDMGIIYQSSRVALIEAATSIVELGLLDRK